MLCSPRAATFPCCASRGPRDGQGGCAPTHDGVTMEITVTTLCYYIPEDLLYRRMTQDKTEPLRYQGHSTRSVPSPVGHDPSASARPRRLRLRRRGGDHREKKCHRTTISRDRTSLPTRTACDGEVRVRPRLPLYGPPRPRPAVCDFGRFPTSITPTTRGEEARRSDESYFRNHIFSYNSSAFVMLSLIVFFFFFYSIRLRPLYGVYYVEDLT